MSRAGSSASSSFTGKGTANDLVVQLKGLHQRLAEQEQEEADPGELRALARKLVNAAVLTHKNRDVQAYAACCVADVLRLAAPDAPFDQAQMRTIFECFVRQLKNLGKDDGHSEQATLASFLLGSLDEVESIVLMCDIGDRQEVLMVDLFTTFFDLAATQALRKNVEAHMIGVMRQLVDEAPAIPEELLNVLLAQFMRRTATQGGIAAFMRDSACDMAAQVMSLCAERLQRNVCAYFSDIISTARDEHGEEHNERELKRAHELVLQLWIRAPAVLQNVVPALEAEMQVESPTLRALAVQTVGLMLASDNGHRLMAEHDACWRTWVGRRNDRHVQVRLPWISSIGHILRAPAGAIRQPDVEKMCVEALSTRLIDLDERVRAAACGVIESLDYEIVKQRLSATVLKQYSERCRDKKHAAQAAALSHIGKLFDRAAPELIEGNTIALDKFAHIPNSVVHCIYVNDKALNALLEKALLQDILKASLEDDEARAERLMLTVSLLDERGRRALFAVLGNRQIGNAKLVRAILQLTGTDDAVKRTGAIRIAAESTGDVEGAERALNVVFDSQDKRLLRLIGDATDRNASASTVRRAIKEAVRRAQDSFGEAVADILAVILRRSAFSIFNRDIVSSLTSAARRSHWVDVAELCLQEITKSHPFVFKANTDDLIRDLIRDPLSSSKPTLKSIATIVVAYPEDIPRTDALLGAVEKLMREGTPAQAKQATSIFARLATVEQCTTAVDRIVDNIAFGSETFLGELCVLMQISLLVPAAIAARNDEIQRFCLQEVLMKNRTDATVRGNDDEPEWASDDLLDPEIEAKVLAVRVLCNRVRAYSAEPQAIELATPVFKLLRRMVANMGELSGADATPLHHRSHLRLECAKQTLKLVQAPALDSLVSSLEFITLAVMAQDPVAEVRRRFLARLYKTLRITSTPLRYNCILFLAAHEPNADLQNQVRRWILSLAAEKSSTYRMEQMAPRLVSLLAHHPDFTTPDRGDDDLQNLAEYFTFYLDNIVNADNLPLVFHYVQRTKQMGDAVHADAVEGEQYADNLYITSEIAQLCLRVKAEHHNWPLSTYPKRLKLPADIFVPLPPERGRLVQERQYLNADQMEQVRRRALAALSRYRTAGASLAVSMLTGRNDDDNSSTSPAKRGGATAESLERRRRADRKRRKRDKADRAAASSNTPRRSSTRTRSTVQYAESASESETSIGDSSDEDDLD
ncbi:Sister chromatid cohesion protein pds5 [Savitreella phatthalungensis]